MNNKPIIIGVGGFARSGKDTFVKVARKILEKNGYITHKVAFADALKNDLSEFIMKYYGINVWTEEHTEKKLIRPLLVAHGCQKRFQTQGRYWVNKIDEMINRSVYLENTVLFISDCRFPNEVEWLHNTWNGWFVHLKKYTVEKRYEMLFPEGYWKDIGTTEGTEKFKELMLNDFKRQNINFELNIRSYDWRIFDTAPNEEELYNDPICIKNANYELELENVMDREFRINGNKITSDSVIDNTYLNKEIKLCLSKCPFLTVK